MTSAELLEDLTRLGIRLGVHGDRLRFSPRSAMTPDLADRMKAHKAELLAILRHGLDLAYIEVVRPDGGRSWIHPDYANDDLEVIDPPDPCPECGTLELWQSMLRNWRCMNCDPPRILDWAQRKRSHAKSAHVDASEALRWT